MRRTKYQKPESRPEARHKWARFSLNEAEEAKVVRLATQAGYGKISDYLRALVDLPPLHPGAPVGNQNRRKSK